LKNLIKMSLQAKMLLCNRLLRPCLKLAYNRTRCALSTSVKLCHKVDYYSVLGVNRNENEENIKAAYFRLAKRYHPDYNSTESQAAMFEMISEAYEVLSNLEKRKIYDEYGEMSETEGGISRGPQRKRGDDTFSSEDLFRRILKNEKAVAKKDVFQDDRAYEASNYGTDKTKDIVLTITFEEAARGCIYQVSINQKVECPKCFGSRAEIGFQGKSCPYCEGTGLETEKVGHIVTRRTCAYCEGSGVFIKFKCMECAGTGITIFGNLHEVTIPPGTENGEILRVPYIKGLRKMSIDKAEFFYVKVMVNKSEYFEKEGLDIRSKADIDAYTSLFGGKIQIRGLHESPITVDIPPGTSSHQEITLPGKGVKMGTLAGNHIVDIGINMTELNKETYSALDSIVADLGRDSDDALPDSSVVIPIVEGRKFL